MYKEFNPLTLDSMTLKHTVIANFGFLLANTTDKNFNKKLDINMRNLTAYLIESEIIEAQELKEIIKSQTQTGINNHYHFTKIFKGDELTEPSLLFQISNIVMNLDKLLFKNSPKINEFFRKENWFRKKIYNKPIVDIYTSYFNIVKLNSQYCDIVKRYTNTTTSQNNLIEAIDFHYHPSEKSIFYYEENDYEHKIRTLKENRVNLLEELCEIVHMQHLQNDESLFNKLASLLCKELEEFKDERANTKHLSLSVFYDIFNKHLSSGDDAFKEQISC